MIPASWDWQKKSKNLASPLAEFLLWFCPIRAANASASICPIRGQKIFPLSALPRSLPLMSPFGLPSAGYPASARWHVFRFSSPPSLRPRAPAGESPIRGQNFLSAFLLCLRALLSLTRSCPLPRPSGQSAIALSRTCPGARLWLNPPSKNIPKTFDKFLDLQIERAKL